MDSFLSDIVIGDLNLGNIIVDLESPKRAVTLIDTDSYQYSDKFPCDVGIEKYSAPEFLTERKSKIRTVQNELFVVCRILFETLMLVDNPYNFRGATDPVDDMKKGEFRYTFAFLGSDDAKRMTNKSVASDELAMKWGHLTKNLKDAFGNTFHHNGKFWDEESRLEIKSWIYYLNEYKSSIDGAIKKNAETSANEIFPKKAKAWIIRCRECEKEVNQTKDYDGVPWKIREEYGNKLCINCVNKKLMVQCEKCHDEFLPQSKKDVICQKCWAPVECPQCGWDGKNKDGKHIFVKWMADENNGVCSACADGRVRNKPYSSAKKNNSFKNSKPTQGYAPTFSDLNNV